MDLAPPKGRARLIAQPQSTRNPIPGATASAPSRADGAGASSRRKLLQAGAALAAAGTVPAAASAPAGDAELVRLADLAADACRGYVAALSDEVHIPPEVDAELDRLSALAKGYYSRAAAIRATTPDGRRAKARIVALANSHNFGTGGDPAFVTLESLLDDLLGGEGSAAALDRRVNFRGDAA